MEDSKIIELYFERNQSAISETKEKYGKLIKRISKNILGNSEDSEECENDTYLGVWSSVPPERPGSLIAYVARIARNLSLKKLEYQTAGKRNFNMSVSLSELEEILPDGSITEDIEYKELGKTVSEFLYTESKESRDMFIRKYWFFDSVSDIAELFSVSESKVKSSLFHTRNRLKKYLVEREVLK